MSDHNDFCDGIGCVARDECQRFVWEEYWRACGKYEPQNGYHCRGFKPYAVVESPAWTRKVVGK